MIESIESKSIGTFTYNESDKSWQMEEGKVHWYLNATGKQADVAVLLHKAERLFEDLRSFETQAKAAIAAALINYKNDFWPDYDEDDEELDWDAVEAGDFNTTKEVFQESITLRDIVIGIDSIYCEYDDGDLFGGHRIHAYFNEEYELVKANI